MKGRFGIEPVGSQTSPVAAIGLDPVLNDRMLRKQGRQKKRLILIE